MANKDTSVIAVSASEHEKFGCPYCGYRSGSTPIHGGGTYAWVCGECKKTSCVLADGVAKSRIGFGDVYPELQPHPRQGTPKHGRPDTRPDGGGEFFRSRGLGLDRTPGCFVCGGEEALRNNIAAFVQCKDAGERVVRMFLRGARLDYRERSPDRVQVKLGACNAHKANLEKLHALVTKDGVITSERIVEAGGPKAAAPVRKRK